MSLMNAHYLDSDPDWSRFCSQLGLASKEPHYAPVIIDIEADREAHFNPEGEG